LPPEVWNVFPLHPEILFSLGFGLSQFWAAGLQGNDQGLEILSHSACCKPLLAWKWVGTKRFIGMKGDAPQSSPTLI